jgi:two-component system, NtrC family, sensor kinase
MLQHSGMNSSIKEPTAINELTSEYLRLSYHGFRANDKSFNAALDTSFDENVGKTDIVPQDIGRVLLNLFNNAFYSLNEKKKKTGDGYAPAISVTTKKLSDRIQITIRDNGNGIPEKVLEKIYQPFFTTKPAGQGTGLGLSLSYDIITKEHGGTIKAETKESEYSAFIIELPD